MISKKKQKKIDSNAIKENLYMTNYLSKTVRSTKLNLDQYHYIRENDFIEEATRSSQVVIRKEVLRGWGVGVIELYIRQKYMKNFLDSKLSEGVKEIIGSTLAKHTLLRHNQRPSQQVFKILRPTTNSKASNVAGNALHKKDDCKKQQNWRDCKENQTLPTIKQKTSQQGPTKEVGKQDCHFDSFRPQKKQTQQGSGLKNSEIKVSVPLSKKYSLNNIAVFEKTPEKKSAYATRGKSVARTIHSLLPSPQITPKKPKGKRQQTQPNDKSSIASPYQASSKKKVYIELVSASLTPSRSPLKASK